LNLPLPEQCVASRSGRSEKRVKDQIRDRIATRDSIQAGLQRRYIDVIGQIKRLRQELQVRRLCDFKPARNPQVSCPPRGETEGIARDEGWTAGASRTVNAEGEPSGRAARNRSSERTPGVDSYDWSDGEPVQYRPGCRMILLFKEFWQPH